MSKVEQYNSIVFLSAFLEDQDFNKKLRQDKEFQKFIVDNRSLIKSLLINAYDFSGNHVGALTIEENMVIPNFSEEREVVVRREEKRSTPVGNVRREIMAILVESTGYPEQVLTDESDLEADLGIDTVKQMEILAVISERFNLGYNEKFQLSDVSTVKKLVDYIDEESKNERPLLVKETFRAEASTY